MERKLIAAAISSALALPMAAQAVEFSVSGHINRAIVSVDGGGPQGMPDANDGDVRHVDANASQTRFRFTGSEELENGMTAGVNLEYGGIGQTTATGWSINARHANVYLSTAGGTISVGHTSTATDGMAHARLGGPSWLGGVTNWCAFHGHRGAGKTTATAGPACESNDGGRQAILKYDTPAIGPASIAVSTGNNDYFDIRLTIAGSMGEAGYDFRIGHIAEYEADVEAVAASLEGFRGSELRKELTDGDNALTVAGVKELRDNEDIIVREGATLADTAPINANTFYTIYTPGTPAGTRDVGDITTMSGAVAFGQGTSVAASWSTEGTGAQAEYQYVELDHSYGDGSIGVYYKTGEYGAGVKDGTEGSLWGIGIGHDLGGGATAYAGYRQVSEDGMKDIDLLVGGMRVTFN